jgi:hypothetical protein
MREKIPNTEQALIDYGANINYRNLEHADELGLNTDDITSLETKRLEFETLHGQCVSHAQSKIVTALKNAAKKDYLKELRWFIKALQANKKMTNTIRALYGINVRKKRSAIGKPDGHVAVTLSYAGGSFSVAVHLEPEAGSDEADPRRDYDIAIYRSLMPPGGATVEQATSAKHYLMKPPVSGDELLYYKSTRKKKVIVGFDPHESGMTAYFCARYENQKGEAGNWGRIVSIVVPS